MVSCRAEPTTVVTYLPYWEHCEPAIQKLEKALADFKQEYTLERIIQLTIAPMGRMTNGVVRIERIKTDGDFSEAMLNSYLFRCMPTAEIVLKANGLDDAWVKRKIESSPHHERGHFENYFLELSGDKLSIFYNNQKVR